MTDTPVVGKIVLGRDTGQGPKAPQPVDPAALKAMLNAGIPEVMTHPKMEPLAPVILERGYHKSLCFYGTHRTGKTKQIEDLIKTFGRDRVGVIDCDRGLATLADLNPKAFVLLTEDDFLTLPANKLAERYLENLERSWEYIRTHQDEFWWVCMDNSTAYSDWVEDRGDVYQEAGKYRGRKGGDDNFGMWRDTAREQLRTIRRYRHLPFNFYINCLEEMERERKYDAATDTMKEIGVARAEPALAGRKAAIRYPATWDLVVRLTKEVSTSPPGTLFRADTQGDNTIVGGSRIPGSVKIPRYLDMGVLTPSGDRVFDPAQHWNIIKIWEAVVGMTAAQWIEWKQGNKPLDTPAQTQ